MMSLGKLFENVRAYLRGCSVEVRRENDLIAYTSVGGEPLLYICGGH